MTEQYLLPKLLPRERVIDMVRKRLLELPDDRAYRVELHEQKPLRSNQQNRLLWSLYQQVIERGGEAMQGWTKEDLHTFFLIQHFGSEVRELFGRKRHVPLRTSSKLSKQDFTDFVESIVRFMAERGVVLDMPDEVIEWQT